jgi:hypothetical protein
VLPTRDCTDKITPVPAENYTSHNESFGAYSTETLDCPVVYSSGIQPGVRVPAGVREDILGGT